MEPRIWSPNVIVSDMETILARLVGESVKVEIVLGPEVGTIRVDRGQIEQILLNLAVNAKDAMPDGGRLTIRTASVDVGLPGTYDRASNDGDGEGNGADAGGDEDRAPQVMLSVTDNGAGMTPDVKARIFEPFFTTKEVGKGTGLGLSVVYGIVKQSGGAIAVESETGHGTTFRIFFPRVVADPADGGVGQASLLPLLRGGTETVLLVEDEESVRRFTARALEAHGYEVISAEGGREAMAAFEARSEEIALVITDVIMPDLGGRALAAFVRSRISDLPLLYISGYAEEAVVSQGMLEAGEHFLQKPFSPADLLRLVRDIIDERRAADATRASGP
jgi:CheY-like chemotaxis protein